LVRRRIHGQALVVGWAIRRAAQEGAKWCQLLDSDCALQPLVRVYLTRSTHALVMSKERLMVVAPRPELSGALRPWRHSLWTRADATTPWCGS